MSRYGQEVNPAIIRALRYLRPKTILDVGCGAGQNTVVAKDRWGAYVIGFDIEEGAGTCLDEVYAVDIESRLHNYFGQSRVDCLVFGDVLEHVRDSSAVLRRFLPMLQQNGAVVVSLPNVAQWGMRLRLLAGNFDYSSKGILDSTHLRFFTRKTALRLVLDAGLTVEYVDSTPGIFRDLLGASRAFCQSCGLVDADARLYKRYKRVVRPVEERVVALWPELLAFQHVIVARKR